MTPPAKSRGSGHLHTKFAENRSTPSRSAQIRPGLAVVTTGASPRSTAARRCLPQPARHQAKAQPKPSYAGGVVGPEDFLPPAKADALLPVLLAHNAQEEEAERQRRRRDEKIDTVLYEQGVASALAFGNKEEDWRREAAEQERIFVDLTSDDDSE